VTHWPTLAPADLHVWTARLAQPDDVAARLAGICDPHERSRAAQIRVPARARAFLVGRGMLRLLLAGYTGQVPSDLKIRPRSDGKPELDRTGREIQFNLAHSGDLVLYAVTRHRQVGVDIEWTGRDLDVDAIARRFLAPAETEALSAIPDGLRRTAFLTAWVRREAHVKAVGAGLRVPLDTKVVPSERWSHTDLSVAAGYVAAVVAEGHDWRISHHDTLLDPHR
jgi:4'-phosphopantetheinyl transferase